MSAEPSPPAAETSDRTVALRLFHSYLRPHWRLLAFSVFCAVIVAAMNFAFAKLLEPAMNEVLIAADPKQLLLIPLAIVAVALVRGVAQYGQAATVNRVGHGVVGEMQVELFGRLVRADLARLRSVHSGALLSAVLYDSGLVREAATSGMINYVQHTLTVFALVILMATQDPWLTLLVLVAAPAASVIMRRFARRTRKAARGAMTETSALSTAVMESLDGVRVIKLENREADEEARVAEVVGRRQRHVIKGANARAGAAPSTESLSAVIIAAVIAYAGWRSSQGAINAGEFVAFLASLMLASQSLRQLANLQGVFAEGLAAATRAAHSSATTNPGHCGAR